MTTTVEDRIERLSAVSLKRVIEPDEAVRGSIGNGQILPDELLSVAGLDLDLDEQARATLSREELASIVDAGIRFESVLTAGFSLDIVRRHELADPRVTYILHELGEETRHSRLFVRLLTDLRPQAKSLLTRRSFSLLFQLGLPLLMTMPAFFCVLVLTGEEVPDLMQKLAGEHSATDPFVREVNRYHRQEEARHLAFARMILPELWEQAGWLERLTVRRVAPYIVGGMFDFMVHPGVYEVVGLPGWKTWRAVNRSAGRRSMKHEALRPIVAAVETAGVFKPGRIPRAWRRIAGLASGATASRATASVPAPA